MGFSFKEIIFYVLFYRFEIFQKNKIIGNNPNNANLIHIMLLILFGEVGRLHSIVKISIYRHIKAIE
jgi:hypothetical protein